MYMTYEQIYEALYGKNQDYVQQVAARRNISEMTNKEWHDWIEYRSSRTNQGM
jgi:hypothetical protein